ncbi:B-cell antigen receptor complex-associated protein beta chain [Narcine bancroftii]|uniref:B-cell antigen receptor complex-associated protein beta chain n=1 Tax=Narcine bancroftii TaxID=1343680 RepID=UPI0038311E6B
MASFSGKLWPILNIMFMLTIAIGVWCKEPKVSYSVPYRAVTKGNNATLRCVFENLPTSNKLTIKWYKHGENPIQLASVISFKHEASLIILNARKLHSGIYYCSLQTDHGVTSHCAAELNVQPKATELKSLKTSNMMKDTLILIQGILLILCLILPGMLFLSKNKQKKKNDDMETYHMYEGLEVMQTAMYEDIGNLKPSEEKPSEDKWPDAEQPNE